MIHFIDLDLDHTGYFAEIYQDSNKELTLKEFGDELKERMGDELYKVIEISPSDCIFVISGNIRIYAWETDIRDDQDTTKYFRHITKRFDENPMTKDEYKAYEEAQEV